MNTECRGMLEAGLMEGRMLLLCREVFLFRDIWI